MMPDVETPTSTALPTPIAPPAGSNATPVVQTPTTQTGSRDPIAVIRPYIVDLDPKVRANAAAALAVVSTDYPAAAGALVDMWIAEKDAAIIDQIERDLITVGADARETVYARLTALEHDSLQERRDAARYCRGRLRLRGIGEGKPESLDALIALTAEHGHRPEDVEQARAVLARLDGDEMLRAAAALRARLQSPDESTRDHTYALLGRFRANGSPLGYYRTLQAGPTPEVPRGLVALVRNFRQRVSTAGSIWRDQAAREARRFSAGFLWTVIPWAAAGACVMSIHLAATLEPRPVATFYTVYVVAVLVSSVALAASAVRRLSPIWLHYDRGAAGLQQALAAATWVFGPALLGVGILLASISFSNRLTNWVAALVAAPLSISVFVAIIRLGTILGFGLVGRKRHMGEVTAWRRLWYSRRVRSVMQTLAGASCGVLTTAALLWLARHGHPRTHNIDEVSRLIEGMWLFLTPTSAAIAAAFSSVDHFPDPRAEGTRPWRSTNANWSTFVRDPAQVYRSVRTTITPRRVLAVALLVPLGIALALVVNDVRTWKPRIEMAPPGQTITALQAITEIPTRRDFRVAFPQRVIATIPEQQLENPSSGSTPDLSLTLIEWTPSGTSVDGRAPDCTRRTNRRVVAEENKPRIDRYLGWGCYSLEAGSLDRAPGIGRFSSVGLVLDVRAQQASGRPLGAGVSDRERLEGQYTLKLDLNAGKEKEPSTKNAAFGDGSTVHLLKRVPADQKLIVHSPSAVLVTATPQILRSPESRPDEPIAEEPSESPDADNSEPSVRTGDQRLRLELLSGNDLIDRGKPDEPSIERILSPGEYLIRVVGPPTPVKGDTPMEHPVALNVLSARRPVIGDGTPPRYEPTLAWPIPARLPAFYEFELPARQTVAVQIPAVFDWAPFNPGGSVRIRYVLELRRVKGQPGITQSGFESDVVERVPVVGDGDQIIQRVLDPGRYRCIVSVPTNTGAQTRTQSPTSTPKVTISFLEDTPADPSNTGAIKK
jgi:hypothetical protein